MTDNIIKYLAACYQADFKAVSLLNFFSKKAGHHLFLPSSELLHGELTEFPVSTAWAKNVEKTMAIYGKEKALFCCAFFLAGATVVAGKKEAVLAPLYIYPTELLEENGIYYIAIDIEQPLINPAIIEADEASEAGDYESLSAALHRGYFKFGKIEALHEVLNKFFPKWDASQLLQFPNLLEEADVKTGLKTAQETHALRFLPAVGLCLLDKPTGSRGILNELAVMAKNNHFSMPIYELLAGKRYPAQQKPLSVFHVPAILSKSQSSILANAGRYPTQLVVGPPGTGKSFTIAALALELLSRGKSVLIASKNDEACTVVADKIERDLGIQGVVVRANRRDYKSELQKRIQNLLSGIDLEYEDSKRLKAYYKLVKQWKKEIEKLEVNIERQMAKQLEDGVFLHNFNGKFVQSIQKTWMSWRHKNAKPLWELTADLERLTKELHIMLRKFIRSSFNHHLGTALNFSRLELQYFVNAIKARTGNRKETYFDATDFKIILRTLPIWTVNTSDIHRVLPLQNEMFDLVIVDEATQCDLASSMPILQRGKSALVVGDPKQLRHLSFLSNRQQQAIGAQFLLANSVLEQVNYRDNSLLDIFSERLPSQERVFFLNEHYRSMPDIVSFSNARFYNNRLQVMTATPATLTKQHLFLIKIEGKRLPNGHNPMEAAFILEEIGKIMEMEAALEPSACQSIGIVSPFREQVNHLQRKVEEVFMVEQLKRHRLMVGTPFSFQGEERDVVFLSLVLDDETHPSSFQYLNREDVFNVSITRARAMQQVVISFNHLQLPSSSILHQYLAHASAPQKTALPKGELANNQAFHSEVKAFLESSGVEQLFTDYLIAGVQLDLAVQHNGRTYGIDLIGTPSSFGIAMQLDSWKILYRTGIHVFFLSYSDWHLEPAKAKSALLGFLGLEQ